MQMEPISMITNEKKDKALVGRYLFELSARETNLMKKRSVRQRFVFSLCCRYSGVLWMIHSILSCVRL